MGEINGQMDIQNCCDVWQVMLTLGLGCAIELCEHSSVRTRPKKLISGDCYTIFNLISSDLKLISTLYVDFYVAR